jgi:hypothetical protein
MATKTNTTTPRVPIETPMFNEKAAQGLTLTRTWVIFFERLGMRFISSVSGGAGPFLRTLDLKDTTVGNDIADATIVHGSTGADMTCLLVAGVLRTAITADLTVRLNIWVAGVSSVVGTFTIPAATPINTAVSFTTFTTATFPDMAILTWDVTASDGSTDGEGVASFSVWYQ